MSISLFTTYNEARLFDGASKLGILGQETVARVDHVDTVFHGNLDNFVAGQVRADGRVLSPFANGVRLVSLYVGSAGIPVFEHGNRDTYFAGAC